MISFNTLPKIKLQREHNTTLLSEIWWKELKNDLLLVDDVIIHGGLGHLAE